MSIPGPAPIPLLLGLLLFSGSLAVVGEGARGLVARWVGLLRDPDPVERLVLDVFLGGAVLYVVSAIPLGLFYPETLPILVLAAALAILWGRFRARRDRWSDPRAPIRLPRPFMHLVGLGAAASVLIIEVVTADAALTGNTFDSSLLTTYVALLLSHHTLPLSLSPVAHVALAYPQGTTALLGSSQALLGLPPARTALLTTPLFLALAPLAAFTWGRRVTGRASAAAAFALLFALFGEWTRTLVSGSNDFVFAFPLVLLLWSWMPSVWASPGPVRWGDAIAFGVLLGFSAALNPVGAEATLIAVPILRLLRPRERRDGLRWVATFLASMGATALLVLPSLYVLAFHGGLATTSTFASQPIPVGLSGPKLVGLIDPFLFRPGDDNLSSFPLLRAVLAVLLLLGIVSLSLSRWSPRPRWPEAKFGSSAFALGVALVSVMALVSLPSSGINGWVGLTRVTSPDELSYLLFAVYTAIAAIPLAVVLRLVQAPSPRAERADASGMPQRPARFRLDRLRRPGPIGAATIALLLILPGVAVTTTTFSPALLGVYDRLGNVSDADFQMLDWAASHLPAGARVVVAPGSAAQFLPGYQPRVVLLYPVLVFGASANNSYANVVRELSNGTLDAPAVRDLGVLGAQFIVVTQTNTVLWPPFSPAPLLSNPSATVVFHSGDAYVFAWS